MRTTTRYFWIFYNTNSSEIINLCSVTSAGSNLTCNITKCPPNSSTYYYHDPNWVNNWSDTTGCPLFQAVSSPVAPPSPIISIVQLCCRSCISKIFEPDKSNDAKNIQNHNFASWEVVHQILWFGFRYYKSSDTTRTISFKFCIKIPFGYPEPPDVTKKTNTPLTLLVLTYF